MMLVGMSWVLILTAVPTGSWKAGTHSIWRTNNMQTLYCGTLLSETNVVNTVIHI